MLELFINLKLKENPFSRFSAEEEIEYLPQIYIQPRYFHTLMNDLRSGNSRLIFGDRGSGKSALILELHRKLLENNTFSIIIDKYDDISLEQSDKHLMLLMIRSIIKGFVVSLAKNSFLIKSLDKYDKEKLAFIIINFYRSSSKREFEDAYNRVTRFKTKNFFKNIYNYLLNRPINIAISCTLEIGADLICKSFNLPKDYDISFYKNYLPELKVDTLTQEEREKCFLENYNLLKDALLDLIQIVIKCGFINTVIFLDRIDEFRALDGKINKIVDFTERLLRDTDLLYTKNLAIVFSIWSEVKLKLNETGVRFDKFKPIDISWTGDNIKEILQKRLDHFANTPPYNIAQLVKEPNELLSLIELANKSPRDLIRLFSTIYDEQSISNSEVGFFEEDILRQAKIKFCRDYDYYSIFPSKRGTAEDIVGIVNKILRVGRVNFRSTDLANEFKFSTQSANSYIKIMKDYGLIIDNDQVVGGAKEFIVMDPKIVFLIKNNVNARRDTN